MNSEIVLAQLLNQSPYNNGKLKTDLRKKKKQLLTLVRW